MSRVLFPSRSFRSLSLFKSGGDPFARPQAPTLSPGPFIPRPIERRGQPWSEEEKRNTLYDGYSPSHVDGIIDFCAPPESLQPDIQAYLVLVHRLRLRTAADFLPGTKHNLFEEPGLEEVASGAAFMERQRHEGADNGIFVDRDYWIQKTPADPSRVALWTHTLTQVRELDNQRMAHSETELHLGPIYVGPTRMVSLYKTNVRAMFPPYIVPIDWTTLLALTYRLYHPSFHPFKLWVLCEPSGQFDMESYVYDAVSMTNHDLIDPGLIPEDIREDMAKPPDDYEDWWPDRGSVPSLPSDWSVWSEGDSDDE